MPIAALHGIWYGLAVAASGILVLAFLVFWFWAVGSVLYAEFWDRMQRAVNRHETKVAHKKYLAEKKERARAEAQRKQMEAHGIEIPFWRDI